MLLKGSGMSNSKAVSSLPLRAIARWSLLAAIAGATLFGAPDLASANSPKLVQASAKVTLDLARSVAVRTALDELFLKPIAQPNPPVLASSDLVDGLTNVLANGVQVMRAPGPGALFVDFEKHGFGGALVLRYRW